MTTMISKQIINLLNMFTNNALYFFFFFFFAEWKNRVSKVVSSTPCHMTTMGNTTYTTQALLELSLELLLSRCWDKNSHYQATYLMW